MQLHLRRPSTAVVRLGRCIAALVGSALFFATLSAAEAANVVQAPECQKDGQGFHIDLSTTSANSIDPLWGVSPGAGPHHMSNPPSNYMNLPNWIQPSATPATGQFPDQTDYTYTLRFHLPCDPRRYRDLSIQGRYAADNWVTEVKLNGQNGNPSVSSCTDANLECFDAATSFAITSGFVQGLNTLTIRVRNFHPNSPSALAVSAGLRGLCGGECQECPKHYPHEWRSTEFGKSYCCRPKPGGPEFCCIEKKKHGRGGHHRGE